MLTDIEKQLKETYLSWNAINGLYTAWAKRVGMTTHALFTLYAIHNDAESCCQRKICDEWLMPKQTVNSILKDLERKGYIFYVPDEKDRRNKLIRLTQTGAAYAERVLSALYAVEVSVLEKMGRRQRQEMIEGNNRFYELLKEEMKEDKEK